MVEFKLQVGCLLVVLYFSVSYIKDAMNKKTPCNPIFDALLAVVMWAIVFDGATAWTVNHMDIVPDWVNRLLHGLFFVFMNSVTVLIFLYMISQTIGVRSKKMLAGLLGPGIIFLFIILGFLNQLYYVEGKTTNYSMGISVIACYTSLLVHFLVVFLLICIKHKTLEKHKVFSIITFMALVLCILMVQILNPEVLISSLVPMLTLVGLYMNFENPALKRLQQYNEEVVTAFATLVENRDNSTGGHIRRTKGYVQIIMNEMRQNPAYARLMTRGYVQNVLNAAPMHDIGKIATPDYILQKPGRLTDEEYRIMKEHAATGGEIIQETFAELDEPEYQQIAYEVARFHHEKWNGKGYPDGLKGEEIPLHARIMAIADVFDAVSAKRCYRDAMPIDKCFQIIEDGAGSDFDPALAAMFLNARDEVLRYYESDRKEGLTNSMQ